MRRRKFIGLIGGMAASWSLAVRAQERMPRVGVLSSLREDDTEARSRAEAFVQGLQERGRAVGRNLQIDYRWSSGNADALRAHAAELIA